MAHTRLDHDARMAVTRLPTASYHKICLRRFVASQAHAGKSADVGIPNPKKPEPSRD
jgi:hypothetical protein